MKFSYINATNCEWSSFVLDMDSDADTEVLDSNAETEVFSDSTSR